MIKHTNVFLIGPMGAGKTTIGRQLAKELKKDFYDSDQEIEARTGADIAWIFDIEGEAGFRQREKKVIEELTNLQGIVMASGGGAVIEPDNRKFLAGRGYVVYLNVSLEQQWDRTKRDKSRPMLQTQTPKKVLEELHAIRDPLYTEIADKVILTDGRTIRSVCNEIVEELCGD